MQYKNKKASSDLFLKSVVAKLNITVVMIFKEILSTKMKSLAWVTITGTQVRQSLFFLLFIISDNKINDISTMEIIESRFFSF